MADIETLLLSQPVESIPTDRTDRPLRNEIGLCLSGGGYRAMLFHLGSLWRLNEVGLLPQLSKISSVSGGSITAAVLGINWGNLAFDGDGVSPKLGELVVQPIRKMADITIDTGSVFGGLFLPGSVSERIIRAYKKHLYGDNTLQNLPDDPPRFVINATNVQSGALWRFMKPYMRDWRVGEVKQPETEIALAVAASSAFPPVLSPTSMKLDDGDFTPNSGEDLQQKPYTTDIVMTDAGVYDNLGLETVWKRYKTVLASDAGGQMQPEPKPKRNWVSHSYRVLDLIDNQVRSLRKRQLIASYKDNRRDGTYWGIRSDISDYHVDTPLDCPQAKTIKIANIPTRLKKLSDSDQEKLINWGYAICDAALRKHVDPNIPEPGGFPYPGTGVG